MVIFLWILVALLAVIIALLSIPIYADIRIEQSYSVTVGWLFFRKELDFTTEEKEEQPQPPKDKPAGKGKKKKETTPLGGQDFMYYLDIIKALFHDAKGFVKALLWRIKIRRVNLCWCVSGEDAYEIAMDYGKACGAFWSVYALLCGLFDIKTQRVEIYPDFICGKSNVAFSCRVWIVPSLILWNVLVYGTKLLIQFLKVKHKKEKQEQENINNKEKAVNENDTASI